MKKVLIMAGFMAALGCSAISRAQDQKTSVGEKVENGAKTAAHKTAHAARSVAHGTKKGAKKVGNETAEVASKGVAHVTDRTYVDKVGPDGQTIMIDSHSKYYYVDEKGHHVYVTKSQLKDK